MATLQPPALNAPTSTLADWMELQTLCSPESRTNTSEIISIGQLENDREIDDKILEDSRIEELADRVINELDRRAKAAEKHYPFCINQYGTVLTLPDKDAFTTGQYTYLFCLLVTEYRRHEMLARSVFTPLEKHVDDLFQICSTVAAAGLLRGMAVSFGFPRPDGSNFLTALRQTFEERMSEGKTDNCPRPGVSSYTKDGGIDIVAWRHFPDGLPSKLYLLGQCASGRNYPNKSVRGFLASFHGDWFTVAPASPPIEALFLPFMLDHDLVVRRSETPTVARAGRYLSLTRDLGIIVDRCRIAYLVEDGAAIAHEKPDWVERASEFSRVRWWVDEIWKTLRAAA